jgi:hypothetical protein
MTVVSNTLLVDPMRSNLLYTVVRCLVSSRSMQVTHSMKLAVDQLLKKYPTHGTRMFVTVTKRLQPSFPMAYRILGSE